MTIRKDPYDWPTLKIKTPANTWMHGEVHLTSVRIIPKRQPKNLARAFKFTRSASNNRQSMEPVGWTGAGGEPWLRPSLIWVSRVEKKTSLFRWNAMQTRKTKKQQKNVVLSTWFGSGFCLGFSFWGAVIKTAKIVMIIHCYKVWANLNHLPNFLPDVPTSQLHWVTNGFPFVEPINVQTSSMKLMFRERPFLLGSQQYCVRNVWIRHFNNKWKNWALFAWSV